jgi:DNA-binding transcriptional regulator GbsR (MarR family)
MSERVPAAEGPRLAEVGVFVERLGSVLTEAGMARLPARIFAALLADDDGRMTAAELAEALHVSPASISGGVRYLTQVRFIHRERERGSRRDVFVVRDDAWHDAMINSSRTYAPIREVLGEGVSAVGGVDTSAGSRIATSVDFLEFLSDELEQVARRWEERRHDLYPTPGRAEPPSGT